MPRKVLQGTVLLQPLWLISETDVRTLPHFPILEGPPVMVSSNVACASSLGMEATANTPLLLPQGQQSVPGKHCMPGGSFSKWAHLHPMTPVSQASTSTHTCTQTHNSAS